MSSKMIPVTIRITGKEYKISCPEGEHDSLIASAKHVNENMRKIREGGKALGAERVAVMAAINIAHELINAPSGDCDNKELLSRVDKLQQNIDEVLNQYS